MPAEASWKLRSLPEKCKNLSWPTGLYSITIFFHLQLSWEGMGEMKYYLSNHKGIPCLFIELPNIFFSTIVSPKLLAFALLATKILTEFVRQEHELPSRSSSLWTSTHSSPSHLRYGGISSSSHVLHLPKVFFSIGECEVDGLGSFCPLFLQMHVLFSVLWDIKLNPLLHKTLSISCTSAGSSIRNSIHSSTLAVESSRKIEVLQNLQNPFNRNP